MSRLAIRGLTLVLVIAFIGLIFAGYDTSPLDSYDYSSTRTVPDCTVEIIIGHYTKIPHRWVTGPCSGVTLKGCLMGGGTYRRWFRPDVPVPAKVVTPFPGSLPLSTKEEKPNEEFVRSVLEDFTRAKAYAKTLLQRCDCQSIKVRIVLLGFSDTWFDNGARRALANQGVTEREEEVTR